MVGLLPNLLPSLEWEVCAPVKLRIEKEERKIMKVQVYDPNQYNSINSLN